MGGDSLGGDVDEADSLATFSCGVEARSIGQQIAANPCGPSLQAAARRRKAIRRLSGGWPSSGACVGLSEEI